MCRHNQCCLMCFLKLIFIADLFDFRFRLIEGLIICGTINVRCILVCCRFSLLGFIFKLLCRIVFKVALTFMFKIALSFTSTLTILLMFMNLIMYCLLFIVDLLSTMELYVVLFLFPIDVRLRVIMGLSFIID